MTEEREHELSEDCWCEPEVVSYNTGEAVTEPTWLDHANTALDADEAYLEALGAPLDFVCAGCGRPPMLAAKRIRKERADAEDQV